MSAAMLRVTNSMALSRVSQKIQIAVENAVMGRLLSLPVQFF